MSEPTRFKCAVCDGTFEEGWPEGEAKAEFAEVFPAESLEETALVCDDCWVAMVNWASREGLITADQAAVALKNRD